VSGSIPAEHNSYLEIWASSYFGSVQFGSLRTYTTIAFWGESFLWGLEAFCIFSAINKRFY